MSSKGSIYPQQRTQALGEHNHTEEKTFSFPGGRDGRLPDSELSQSCGLHFWVLSGQGSWSQRLLSSSASPVLVLMHLTWRRWMPPPQGAVHCGSGEAPSAPRGYPSPHPPQSHPPTLPHTGSIRSREVFMAVTPSLVLRVGVFPPILCVWSRSPVERSGVLPPAQAHLSPGAHHPCGAGVGVAGTGGVGP